MQLKTQLINKGEEMKRAIILTMAVAVLACGAPAVKHDFVNHRLLASDFQKTWNAVIDFFAENNVPIKTIDKSSGLIYAEHQIFPETWIDCGQPSAYEGFSDYTGNFNVLVRGVDDSIQVRVTATFGTGVWSTTLMGTKKSFKENRTSYSTGVIEQALLDYIEERAGVELGEAER